MPHDGEFQGAHAHRYNQRPSFWRSQSVIDLPQLQLKPGQRLLDVGCGTGTDLGKLFKRYGDTVELYGVDPSGDMLKQMPKQAASSQSIQLEQASATKLPYASDFFDYVTCSLVLHHLPSPDQQKALREMYRVLKPGGVALIKEWGKPKNSFGRIISWLWRNHAYVSKSTSIDFQESLLQTGFKKVEIISIKRVILYRLAATK